MANLPIERYIQSFVIGASWPVFIWYFLGVSLEGEIFKVDYKWYSMVAPVFLGLLNVFGLYLASRYNLDKLTRFLLTALIGAITISTIITLFDVWDFSSHQRLIKQYIHLIIIYTFAYVVIVFILEELLTGV